MHCTMAEDLQTQIHGYVFVNYQIGNFEYDPPPDLFKGGTNLFMQGSPVRVCAFHMCLDHPIMKAIARVVLAASGAEVRARSRMHEGMFGNNEEKKCLRAGSHNHCDLLLLNGW